MGTPRSVAGTPRFGSGDIDPVQRLRAVFISSITDVFSSLPPRAATIETDAFSPLPRPPAKPTVELFFSKAYPSAPKVVCWLLLKPDGAATDPALVRVKASSVTVTAKSAVVNLPPEAASNPRAVLYWFAFTTQKTNPVLTATLQKIFSHPSSFPKSLEADVEECVRVCDIDEGDHIGQTLLHAASCSGNLQLVNWLVTKGASIDCRDEHGWTPMLAAVSAAQPETAQQLLTSGANFRLTCERGMTGLHILCRWPQFNRKQVLLARQLVSAGLSVNVLNDAGETPLLYLCKKRELCMSFATVLLELGADPSTPDTAGTAPIHVAALRDNVALAEILASRGADVFARGPDGTPLAIAAKRKCEAMRLLLTAITQLPSAVVETILLNLPPWDLQRVGLVSKTFLRTSRKVFSDASYWARFGLPRELYVSLCRLVAKQGISVSQEVPSQVGTLFESLRALVVPPEELASAKPVAKMLLTIAGSPRSGKKTFIRRFCERHVAQAWAGSTPGSYTSSPISGGDWTIISASTPPDVPPTAGRLHGKKPKSRLSTSHALAEAEVETPSSSSATEAASRDDGEDEGAGFNDEEEKQAPFFEKTVVRLQGKVVELFFFTLGEELAARGHGARLEAAVAAEHPFAQFWRLSAACIVLADLSFPDSRSCIDSTRRSIDHWRTVCSEGKDKSVVVVGSKRDAARGSLTSEAMMQMCCEAGMLYIPCSAMSLDDTNIDLAVKVACDIAHQTSPQSKSPGDGSSGSGGGSAPSSSPGGAPSTSPSAATSSGKSRSERKKDCSIS